MHAPVMAALLSCVLLLAFVCSCAATGIRWQLPADMPPDARDEFATACADWNAVAIEQQSIGPGDRRVIYWPREQMQTVGANAETSAREMRIARDIDSAQRPKTMTHELGHALGLKHHQGAGVMAADAPTTEILEADRAECRRVGACQ